jgi:serine/threonine protein kinase
MKQFPILPSMEEELKVIRKMAGQRHANIVEIQDCWVGVDTAYIVMELCRGNLADLQSTYGQPLLPRLLYEILLQVTRGIEHLHAHEICHRDLKPENGNSLIVAEPDPTQSYLPTTRNPASKSPILPHQ